jgi:glycerol-1-phosphate dehydrogenase [NAD(P)+]
MLIYGADAFKLAAHAVTAYSAGRKVKVVMDIRTREVAGIRIADSLASAEFDTGCVVVEDRPNGSPPQCDNKTMNQVRNACAGADIIIAAGSGVLNDLAKWASFEMGVPYLCFATAASMNGYTSANIAVTANSVKTIARAVPPRVVLSSPDVLCAAPYRMTAAGLGDVLAKSVSSADWKMNNLIFKDYYCERAAGLIGSVESMVMNNPGNLAKQDSSSVEELFKALLLTGAAMTMAESSSPASGGEHLISHSLDMMSLIDHREHDLHGRQVGVATVLTSELYSRVMAIESPILKNVATDIGFWGVSSDEVKRQFEGKTARLKTASEYILAGSNWDLLRQELKQITRPAGQIQECLKNAGAALTAQDILCSKERLLSAFLHSHEIRSRFTIIDLAWITGVLPQSAKEIVEAWA